MMKFWRRNQEQTLARLVRASVRVELLQVHEASMAKVVYADRRRISKFPDDEEKCPNYPREL
jgi:hypothetical protein